MVVLSKMEGRDNDAAGGSGTLPLQRKGLAAEPRTTPSAIIGRIQEQKQPHRRANDAFNGKKGSTFSLSPF